MKRWTKTRTHVFVWGLGNREKCLNRAKGDSPSGGSKEESQSVCAMLLLGSEAKGYLCRPSKSMSREKKQSCALVVLEMSK